MVVVRVRPYCSPDTSGPQYEQYCQQKLMLHQQYQQLKAGYDTYAEAFAGYLQSGSVLPSLEDDLHRLQQQQQQQQDPGESNSDTEELSDEQGQHNQAREEWMLSLFQPVAVGWRG